MPPQRQNLVKWKNNTDNWYSRRNESRRPWDWEFCTQILGSTVKHKHTHISRTHTVTMCLKNMAYTAVVIVRVSDGHPPWRWQLYNIHPTTHHTTNSQYVKFHITTVFIPWAFLLLTSNINIYILRYDTHLSAATHGAHIRFSAATKTVSQTRLWLSPVSFLLSLFQVLWCRMLPFWSCLVSQNLICTTAYCNYTIIRDT
jgi:hypothetical protein